ncbi:MAG: type II/IV secretion system ATPase subunit [Candidatus Aenigmarchaeota archaeon]|nr:type II/IV secretion system ATPase subunit [Candidatus Aenigmarchaeota archaeon]
MVYEYEYDDFKQEIRVNCLGAVYGSSIEDSDVCMAKIIDHLTELKKVVRILMIESRQYEYDFKDAKLLLEIGNAVQKIENEKILQIANLALPHCEPHISERYQTIRKIISEIKYDPVEAYKKLLREIRHTKIKQDREPEHSKCHQHYIENVLKPLHEILDSCEIIKMAKPELSEIKHRSFYRKIFQPTVRPNFMLTRFMSMPPTNSELIHFYKIEGIDVQIYKIPGKIRKLYHIIPPEFKLTEEEYELLDKARQYIGIHEPRETELAEHEHIRENMFNISLDMLRDLSRGTLIKEKRLMELANILTRYTAGLGILELILADSKVQDVLVNSPIGKLPIFIFHEDYEECITNIVPSIDDADSWATRFRLYSGRPLDEANPVLDTELDVPGGRARVAAITRSLSPDGLGFAFRRHREKPWTYPMFIKNKMLNPLAAGLMWFLIENGRSIFIAGTRSSGKTSFLSSSMIQIMSKLRIISQEDTLELPVDYMRSLGFNIERLKSRSVITQVETEVSADEALRTALRLGDSCLVVGEVRSKEARALFEAMRIGAMANTVMGTIHGGSAYGVFDRVVNDLGVPLTSFKATDIILVCNLIRSPDGLRSFRRVVSITEVRKQWDKDPLEQGGFVPLMEYSAQLDGLKPTDTLLMGESQVLNDISFNIKEWRGRWDSLWDNINLRAKILETLTEFGNKNPDILESENVLKSNTMFHIICGNVMEEIGNMDSKEIFIRWERWAKKNLIREIV